MSLSKRMVAAGLKGQPHPLAGWKSRADWGQEPASGRWVNEIGLDLATIADPGFEITPSKCPGFVAVAPNSYSRGTWVPDAIAPPPPPKPEPIRKGSAFQLTMF